MYSTNEGTNLLEPGTLYSGVGHHILRHLSAQSTVQVGLVLSNLFLHNFALMWLENLQHFSNLGDNFWFNVIGHNDPWPHLSSVEG